MEVGVGVGEGLAPLGDEDYVVVVVADEVARLGGAAAEAAGGVAVVGVEVEVRGHWDAYQVVSLQESLVVGEAGDFAGGSGWRPARGRLAGS